LHPKHLLPAPRDEAELRARLTALGGRSLKELADRAGLETPPDLRRDKGWVGTLLERTLGATAGSRAEPDFPTLGIELKSLPIDAAGRPVESTFVASLDLAERDLRWEISPVRKKLARVAWVVVEAAKEIPLAQRRVGAALLWSPSEEEFIELRRDYEADHRPSRDCVAAAAEGAQRGRSPLGARRRRGRRPCGTARVLPASALHGIDPAASLSDAAGGVGAGFALARFSVLQPRGSGAPGSRSSQISAPRSAP